MGFWAVLVWSWFNHNWRNTISYGPYVFFKSFWYSLVRKIQIPYFLSYSFWYYLASMRNIRTFSMYVKQQVTVMINNSISHTVPVPAKKKELWKSQLLVQSDCSDMKLWIPNWAVLKTSVTKLFLAPLDSYCCKSAAKIKKLYLIIFYYF